MTKCHNHSHCYQIRTLSILRGKMFFVEPCYNWNILKKIIIFTQLVTIISLMLLLSDLLSSTKLINEAFFIHFRFFGEDVRLKFVNFYYFNCRSIGPVSMAERCSWFTEFLHMRIQFGPWIISSVWSSKFFTTYFFF